MPSWTELLNTFAAQRTDVEKSTWLAREFAAGIGRVSNLRDGRNVIIYGSAFLQKPTAPGILLQITLEEINGFMSVMHGMDWSKGLTLILHTPGGVTNATETIVAYLRSKFSFIEVIVPTYAMSAGTMIALSGDRIVMGRQSQLGPIDPQIPSGQRLVSALAILDQFDRAKKEITENRDLAHVWAPILPSLGPALLEEAQNAIDYSEKMVAEWLAEYQFVGRSDAINKAKSVAEYFSKGDPNVRKRSHGRRIDREEAKAQNLIVEDLEDSQELQEAVLTAYHLLTIIFEKSPALKILQSSVGKGWVKNLPTMPNPR